MGGSTPQNVPAASSMTPSPLGASPLMIESVLYTIQKGGGEEREGQHWDESPTNPSETPRRLWRKGHPSLPGFRPARHGIDFGIEKRDPLEPAGKYLSRCISIATHMGDRRPMSKDMCEKGAKETEVFLSKCTYRSPMGRTSHMDPFSQPFPRTGLRRRYSTDHTHFPPPRLRPMFHPMRGMGRKIH